MFVMTKTKHRTDFEFPKDTLHITSSGELNDVCCEPIPEIDLTVLVLYNMHIAVTLKQVN